MMILPTTIWRNHKRTLFAVVFVFLYSFSITLAVPPTTKYAPGATLDPACAPSDTNCSVQILPDQTSNANKYLTTDGSSTAWSSNTLILGGNFTTTGNYATTLTTTGTTAVTLPTSGTLATTANITAAVNSAVSGTLNYVPKFTGANTIGNSVIFDDGTNIGIGDITPSYKLEVNGTINAHDAITTQAGAGNITGGLSWSSTDTGQLYLNAGGVTTVNISAGGNSYFNGGNVGIGTSVPTTAKLIVASDWDSGATNNTQLYLQGSTDGNKQLRLGFDTTNNFGYIQALVSGSSTNNLVLNPSGGNIGIGTTSPAEKLDINGALRVTNGNGLFFGGTTDAITGSNATHSLTFYTNNVLRTTIDSSGNVIIADLAGSGNRCVYADTNGQLGVKSDDCGLASGGDDMGDHTATQNITLGSNWLSGDGGNEGIKIDSSGNVGIGTGSPSTKLTVSSTTSLDGILSTNTNRNHTIFRSTGEHSFVFIDSGHSNTYLPVLYFQRSSVTYGAISLQRASSSDSLGAYVESEMLAGTSGATPFSLQTNGVRRVVIDSSGNVGIGTASPGYALDVAGAINIPNGYQYQWGDGTTQMYGSSSGTSDYIVLQTNTAERMRIDNAGNVGIGTTSPGKVLDVNGTLGVSGRITSTQGNNTRFFEAISATTGFTYSQIKNTGGEVWLGLETSTGGGLLSGSSAYSTILSAMTATSLHLGTSSAIRMTIDSSGNVGIGTASPTALLHLSAVSPGIHIDDASTSGTLERFRITSGDIGTTQSALFSFSNNDATSTGNTTVMTINESGNVGIGTTSPGVSLQVNGNGIRYVGSNAYTSAEFVDGGSTDQGTLRMYASGTLNTQISADASSVSYFNAGSVGIGTSTPANKLHVAGTTRISNSDGVSMLYMTHGATTGTTYSEIDALIGSGGGYGNLVFQSGGGNVGIGTTTFLSSVFKLQVGDGSADNRIVSNPNNKYSFGAANSGGGVFYMGAASNSGTPDLVFSNSAGAERVRIGDTGSVGIGTATLTEKLTVAGNIYASAGQLIAASMPAYPGGTAMCHSGGYVGSCSSDRRLKENIRYFDETMNSLELMRELKPAIFDALTGEKDIPGFIAQEVQDILPNVVTVNGSDGYLLFSRDAIVPYAVKAIQELDIKVQALPEFDDDGSMAQKVAEFLEGIAEGIANIARVNTDKLCVGQTCVTESQLQQLLNNANANAGGSGGGNDEPDPTPEPETPPEETPSGDGPPEEGPASDEPVIEEPPAPEPHQEGGQATPEPEPDPEPTPGPPAPDPEPAP